MLKFIVILGLVAIFSSASADVTCPSDDENSDAIYYPHETECGKFYECNHGTAEVFDCPNGLYWDISLNVCNRNVDCGNLLTSTPKAITDPDEPTDPPAQTTTPPPPTTEESK